MLFIIISRYI